MKRWKTFLVGMVMLCGVVACTPWQKQAVKTALDVISYACVLGQAESTDAEIQKACNLADDVMPATRELLAQHRAAAQRYAAKKCP